MTDKQMLIKELKEQAEHVKQLSKNFRKRRPVVIEFSGSNIIYYVAGTVP